MIPFATVMTPIVYSLDSCFDSSPIFACLSSLFAATALGATINTMRGLRRARRKLADQDHVPLDMALKSEQIADPYNCYDIGMAVAAEQAGFGGMPEITPRYYQIAMDKFFVDSFNGTPESSLAAYNKLERLGMPKERMGSLERKLDNSFKRFQ